MRSIEPGLPPPTKKRVHEEIVTSVDMGIQTDYAPPPASTSAVGNKGKSRYGLIDDEVTMKNHLNDIGLKRFACLGHERRYSYGTTC
jgi:hypothetical protein